MEPGSAQISGVESGAIQPQIAGPLSEKDNTTGSADGDNPNYWEIAERLMDGFYRASPEGLVLVASPKAVATIGYDSADEVVGKLHMSELWANPEERKLLLAEIAEHGEARSFETTMKKRNGDLVRVELSVVPVLDAEGNVIATDGVVRDVTERSRSEQQFRAMILNSPGAVFRFVNDSNPRYTYISDVIEDITGYPAQYFLDTQPAFQPLVHPDDQEGLEALQAVNVEAGGQYSLELQIIRADGEVRWIQMQGSGSADPLNGTVVADGVILDITDLHEARAAVEASEALFRELFESMAEGYWITDLNGVVEMANPAAAKILGYADQDDVIGLNSLEFMLDEEARAQLVTDLLEKGRIIDYEIDVRGANDRRITLNFSTRLRGEGEALHAESTFRDVTLQKQIEAEIREARHAAEQANRAKSTFLANMSHELRTPLNAIIGYSEMMLEEAEDLDEDIFSEDLQKVYSAGTHLLSLINDVLDLSKIEAGRTELFLEDFTLEELVNSVTATVEPMMVKNDNELKLEISAGDTLLHQDLTKLRQSLLNLLSNAAKFTHNGSVTLETSVHADSSEQWLTLAVTDTGIGIDPAKHESLFDEFSQADASTTRQYGGTGLGLAISRRFCQLLGGDITLRSAPGEGSSFTIRIPVSLIDNVGDISSGASESSADSLPRNPAKTVLVIDDDPEACDIISRHLTRSGYEVVSCNDGQEGLRLAAELEPCAITLDVMMPEMDGWSVLSRLKADDQLKDIPIIMVSMLDDKTRGYTLGATSYLSKPVDREALLDAITSHRIGSNRVLIIEDHEDTRAMMARVIDKAGFIVRQAADGAAGMAALEQETPDIILLDLMLPVMNGFDFLVQLRGDERWREVPVVVVTAKDLTETERRFLSGRVQNVLEKGAYTREHLLGMVRSALAGHGQPGDTS